MEHALTIRVAYDRSFSENTTSTTKPDVRNMITSCRRTVITTTFRTVVQQLTNFQLTQHVAPPSLLRQLNFLSQSEVHSYVTSDSMKGVRKYKKVT